MAETMRAAYINGVGPADQIIIGTLPKPAIGQHQVLVRVRAVAVDRVDTYIRSGKYALASSFPYILGRDMCGVVEQVGKEVTNFKQGERVWSNTQGIDGRQGTFSEFAVVDENLLYHLPEGVDEKQAVATFHSAATALHGLIRVGKLLQDETIFINGAAGGVGSAVLQFALLRGAKAIASAGSDEKVEWLKGLGAEHVFNYKKQNIEEEVRKIQPKGIDVFWDTSGSPNLDTAVNLMAPYGRILLMAGSGSEATLPIGPFYNKELSLLGFTLFRARPEELRAYAEIINRALKDKKLTARIANTMPLSDAAKAHQMLENDSNLWGKIILTL